MSHDYHFQATSLTLDLFLLMLILFILSNNVTYEVISSLEIQIFDNHKVDKGSNILMPLSLQIHTSIFNAGMNTELISSQEGTARCTTDQVH